MSQLFKNEFENNGFVMMPAVFSDQHVTQIMAEISDGLKLNDQANIKSSRGETYAARNLIEVVPSVAAVWRVPQLIDILRSTLGEYPGLVRALFFDKHPDRTWSLPYHKDMTIAVKDNTLPSQLFSRPTRKSGVAHVEAPTFILDQMLTLRIHLDKVTNHNGPLQVIPGSHKNGKTSTDSDNATAILATAGDVLAMRPLLSHASGSSTPGTRLHRRILHLEFAAEEHLPDGFAWNQFVAM